MTYGAHQEAASLALHDLLTQQRIDLTEPGVVLGCREHCLLSLTERLRLLGDSSAPATTSRAFQVTTLARQPVQQLARLLDTLPRPDVEQRAPSDLLPGPPAARAQTVPDRWRCVARNLMLGNAELVGATRQPWVAHRGSAWHLLADTATTLEAIIALDPALARTGAFASGPGPDPLTLRLVAGDVAKISRWSGTDPSPDLAAASPLNRLGLNNAPRIHMIRRVEDYAAAQRALAGFLNPGRADEDPGLARERPGLLAARAVATGQIRLAQAFARWSTDHDAGATLAGQFQDRIPAYHALFKSTARLVEVEQRRSPLAVAQQSEMARQLRTITPGHMSHASLADLNDATHELTVDVGKALRREGMRRKNILVLRSPGPGLPQPRVITNSAEPFNLACKALADDPAPPEHHLSSTAPVERERLRIALDETPSRRGPSRVRTRHATTGSPAPHLRHGPDHGRRGEGPHR